MKNHFIFVESNTTGTGMLALKKAQALGYRPIFFTNKPERYIGLEETGTEVVLADTNSIDLLKQTIEKTIDMKKVAGILTTSDFYLETAAHLAAEYGLPGNTPNAIRTCRDKVATRLHLAEAGIGQPKFMIVRSIADADNVAEKVGLPCIVKPADDSGSNLVRLCYTLDEIYEMINEILSVEKNVRGQDTAQTVLIEEYVEGPEVSVEMLGCQGEMSCIGITQKSLTGIPYFVEYRHLFPAPLPLDTSKEIMITVEKALKYVGMTNGATHTEVKLTAQGSKIVEINPRLAGGMIPELIRHSTGIDMVEKQILSALGKLELPKFNYQYSTGIQFLVSEKEGVLADIKGIEEIQNLPGIEAIKINAKIGDHVYLPRNAYHRLGHIMAKGDAYEQTQSRLDHALDKLSFVVHSDQYTSSHL